MKDFCILQWTEEEQIIFNDVASAYSVSDSISKPTRRTKFYEHMEIMMGRRKPTYVHSLRAYRPSFSTCSLFNPLELHTILEDFKPTSVGR